MGKIFLIIIPILFFFNLFVMVKWGEARRKSVVMCSYTQFKSPEPCAGIVNCGDKIGYLNASKVYSRVINVSYVDHYRRQRNANLELGLLNNRPLVELHHLSRGNRFYNEFKNKLDLSKIDINPAHSPHIVSYGLPFDTKIYADTWCKKVLYSDLKPVNNVLHSNVDDFIYNDLKKQWLSLFVIYRCA